jgi:branched-chain amino acid transport system ATP-binding protein
LLTIRNLFAGYANVNVLRGIDVHVHPGEMVALVGANGAGKTTLLKCVSGLMRHTSGSIEVGGVQLASSPASRVRAGIAHVPEGRQIFGGLTVEQNLRLGAYSQLRQIGQREITLRIEGIYSMFPILRERRLLGAAGLSGGQQQMLAIGRGLMAKPRLLLLDEPSLGLSPALVTEIFRTLMDLRSTGASILLAEQNARMSLAIANRGYVIETGQIVLSGSGTELLNSDAVRDRYLGVGADAGAEANAADAALLGKRLRAIVHAEDGNVSR